MSKEHTLKKSYNDFKFLNSPDARHIRILCEFTAPGTRFRKHGIEQTIVFYGSARIQSKEMIEAHLRQLEAENKVQVCEKRNKRIRSLLALRKLSHFYDDAVHLAHDLTQWSLKIPNPKHRFHIITGGGPGIMEAANKGTHDAGGIPIGMNISLPYEQDINPYCSAEVSSEFHYFFVRKYWLLLLSKALIAFPGGFGTFDELFEVLTLIQTKKIAPIPIILFGSEYWNTIVHLENFANYGLVDPEDLSFFKIIDTVEEAVKFLTKELGKLFQPNPEAGL